MSCSAEVLKIKELSPSLHLGTSLRTPFLCGLSPWIQCHWEVCGFSLLHHGIMVHSCNSQGLFSFSPVFLEPPVQQSFGKGLSKAGWLLCYWGKLDSLAHMVAIFLQYVLIVTVFLPYHQGPFFFFFNHQFQILIFIYCYNKC